MKTNYLILSIALLSLTTNIIAQGNIAQPELESGSIESQFDYIIDKSSSFKEFQLIRRSSILKVKDNALDSIKRIRKELITTQKAIPPLQANITTLENELQTLKNEVVLVAEEKDSISLFGKNINKKSYNTIVWSLIVALLVLLVLFVLKFKGSSSVTNNTKKEFDKMQHEFEDFRKKSLKKEQEIMRKLQDEINKNH